MIITNYNRKILYKGQLCMEYSEEGEGDPIILLHGLFGNLSNWSETIRYFSRKNRVITPILPIYKSYWKKDVLTELVEYLHSLVTELKLKNIVLVGNSLGGHVAILYTLAHTELISHLVLTGSSGLLESNLGVTFPKRGDYNYISEKAKFTFFNEEAVTETLIADVYETVNDLRKSIGVLKTAKAANRNNVSDLLGDLKTPTLLIWGREDRVTPVEVGHQFRNLIGGKSELHIIPNCGHAPMMEQPDTFNFILNNYLQYTCYEKVVA